MERPKPKARPATIYDVARKAGVSHQTVSRYLQDFKGIRPETKNRVAAAIKKLDYRPNLTARSLNTGRSFRIAALTQELTQVGPGKILEGASIAAREAGYALHVISLDVHDPEAIRDSIEKVLQSDLAGVLGLASTDEIRNAFDATRFRVPSFIASTDDQLHDPEINAEGLESILSHLKDLGHRDILHIAGSPLWVSGRNRAAAFLAGVKKLGLKSHGVIYGDWSSRSGYQAIHSLAHIPATAVVAANDQTALGAILALSERGYKVPKDVSVTGIEDTPEAAFYNPPLTTVRLDFASEGRQSLQLLLAKINNEPFLLSSRNPAELVTRGSTAKATKSKSKK